MLKKLKPVYDPPKRIPTPQCCVEVEDTVRLQQWRLDRYKALRPEFDPLKCQREASVEIDGKPYCSNHGGRVALKKWLRGELVEKEQ